MPDKPFFMYYAPGATHAPHHVPEEWADKYRGGFDAGLGRAARGDVRPAEGARGHPRRRRAHRPPRRDPRLRRHARRAQAGAGPADGGLRRVPRAHRPPHRSAARHPRGAGDLDDTLDLPDHRRQRCQCRGHHQRHASTRCSASTVQPHSRPPSSSSRDRRASAARPPTTTTPWAGPTPCARRTSGPSRSPRTGAGPATAPSSTGRTGSRPRARSGTSSTTSSTSPPPCSKWPASPSPTFVNGIQQKPLEGTSMAYASTTPDAGRPARDPVLRDVLQPGHLPQGLDRGHPAQHPLGGGR